MLSTKSEIDPFNANQVNVNGTLGLIDLAIKQGAMNKNSVKFFFPSSIAVYGMDKKSSMPVKESEFLFPKTIYGMNKLYCEQLGVYFSNIDYIAHGAPLKSDGFLHRRFMSRCLLAVCFLPPFIFHVFYFRNYIPTIFSNCR